MRGGNMAAISPPESPKRQDSLLEDVYTFGSSTDALELKGYSDQTEEFLFLNAGVSQYRKNSENVDNERVSVPSHFKVIECEAKGDQTSCKSPKDGVLEPKMAESPGGEQRAFDCSETEDSSGEESHSHKEENSKYETTQTVWPEKSNETHLDAEEIQEKEDSCVDQPSSGKELSENQVGNVDLDGVEDNDKHAELTSTPKKCRLECKECGKRFTRREMFYLHRHYHAHKDELMPLTCKECGLSFSDRRSLMKHRHEHKEEEEPKYEEESGFQCAECEKIFSSVRKLRSHKCIESDDKPFRCTLCRQEFQSKVSITKHMLNHSLDEGFKCKECGKRFPEYRIMRVHQRCHPNFKPYECPECGMVFKYQSVMEDHRRKHTDKQPPHLCNICGKTFKYSGLFQQHQYLHTGEKAFSCPECGKKFAFAQNVKAHCRLHRLCQTNPLPFSEQPTKQTSLSAPVQRKENAHQSEDPKHTFNCPLCPQTCSTPANLRAHMLIHEVEYETLERSTETPPEVKKELLVRNREEGLLSDLHQTRVQWKVDGEEVIPFQSSQHLQEFASPRQERPSESSAQKRSSPSRVDELSAPRAYFSASSGSLQVGSVGSSSFMNGAVLWSVQPPHFGQELQSLKLSTAPVPTQKRETSTQALSLTVNQLEKSQIDAEADKQRAECIVDIPTTSQIDQSSPMPLLTPVSQGEVRSLWDIQAPLGISGKMNLPVKQAAVTAATWTNIQSQNATRQLPIPFHHFGQGIGTAVWGFQNNHSLLTGQLKPGSAQELQQQTLVAGSQIILNQPNPFFSPPLTPLSALALSGTHPLHTVTINALQRPPHPNIFFTPQGVMTKRPPMPQTLPLSQLTSQADAHKLGVSHLPFSPDRLMQCMICGISFPQELDLQMHYLQHAQGQI
ncbi:uncharacterized protein [Nerophis lumbriciformis]|uniref:uncharacterized protein isoform X3 n=1 Tax=Nerophis lumbriciformis TaxID=546530 RepID=UPI002AE02524|nr:zinc finger protein 407-like isoform X3 [Nerophis lumbriciformis]